MSTQLEKLDFDETHFQQHLPQYYRSFLREFRRVTRSFVTFNLSFSLLFAMELFCLFFFLPFLSRSSILAFALGGLFLTCFSYLLLLFYFQAKKPEQLIHLKDRFIDSCRKLLPTPPGDTQHHLSIAEALSKLSAYLQDFEWSFYRIPSLLRPLSKGINRFSAYCYGEDVFRMKQLLLHAVVEEHLKQIRITPTDLEVHASLANAYIAFSRLYKEPAQPSNQHRNDIHVNEDKFRKFARLAVEEFRILNHYAPNDPWVHEQLATGYRELCMPAEEICEVELLLKLRPQDKEILSRLGSLYFLQGQNAKGLQIYEELKQANYKKAEELIAAYGSSLQ